MLDLLGLATRPAQLPGVLSGGQRQRLAIARALANEPTLLLADEPTGALDTAGGHEVLELFKRLHADGQTILMVTHNDEVAAAGDRIVRMRDGRVESDGVDADAARGVDETSNAWPSAMTTIARRIDERSGDRRARLGHHAAPSRHARGRSARPARPARDCGAGRDRGGRDRASSVARSARRRRIA